METKFITITGFKGGVGKTTSAICLSCLFSEYGQTLLIDSDPNRSASAWGVGEELPFTVATENNASRLLTRQKFDFVVIDTPARPGQGELDELSEGCDLMVLPSTPDTMSLEALALTIDALPSTVNYCILLTMIPPAPQRDGQDALEVLQAQNLPVIPRGIRSFKVYKDAATQRLPVYRVTGGKKAWRDWQEIAKLNPIQELLNLAKSSAPEKSRSKRS